MLRILITGGTGYIGSSLIKYLLSLPEDKVLALNGRCGAGLDTDIASLKDHDSLNQQQANSLQSSAHHKLEIYCLARQPFNIAYLSEVQTKVHWCEYDGSLHSVKAALEKSKPDLVYHLATFFNKGHGDAELPLLLQANIELGCNLIEAMSQQGIRHLIYTTSITEFGANGAYQPATLYAAMKRAFLDIAQFYVQQGALKLGVLVLTDTYGPQDSRPKVMNSLKQAVAQGQEMCFSSTGEQVFDLVYIDDVLEALYLLGRHIMQGDGRPLQCYQVFADKPLSIKDTVQVFAEVNHIDCEVSWAEQAKGQVAQEATPSYKTQNTANVKAQSDIHGQSNTQGKTQAQTVVRVYPRVPGWQGQVSLHEGMRLFFQD